MTLRMLERLEESLLLAFWAGFVAVIGQVLFVRETLALLGGNEISLAWVFFCWFAGIGGGALLAGFCRWRPGTGLVTARVILLLLPIAAALEIAAMRTLRARLELSVGQLPGLAASAGPLFLTIVPFAFLSGILLPALTAVGSGSSRGSVRQNPGGWVYGFDAAGCLAGGVVFTFVLAGRVDPFTTLGGGLLASVVLTSLPSLLRRRWRGAVPLLLLGLVFWGRDLPGRWERQTALARWESALAGYRLVFDQDSRCQRVSLGERDGQYLLCFNGVTAAVFPDPLEEAMAANLFMNEAVSPREVLLAGQGAEGELQHVLAYPVRAVTLVFTDPVYLSAVRAFLSPGQRERLADPRVQLEETDAQHFLRATRRAFDVIALRPPPPVTAAANGYYTREFFALCRNRLTPTGVVTLSLPGDENYLGRELGRTARTVYRTLRAEFADVRVIPGTRLVFFAACRPGVLTLAPSVLAARYTAQGLGFSENFTPYHFELPLQPERLAWIARELARPGEARINTAREPDLFFQTLKLWDIATDSGLGAVLPALERLSLKSLISGELAAFCLLPAAWAWVSRRRRSDPAARARVGALAGMAALGAAGMSLEFLLLYQYQVTEGSLYSGLGLLTALFMAGMFLGGTLLARRERFLGIPAERWAFFFLPLCAAGTASALAFSLGRTFPGGGLLIAVQSVLAGFAVGGYFPAACTLLRREGWNAARAASALGALDYLGALLGSGFTGIVLLPVLGVEGTLAGVGVALAALPLNAWLLRVR